ncbi:MAG TPA: hypothetical protein VGF69_24405 [Thermoanaerobaculia bacterium]
MEAEAVRRRSPVRSFVGTLLLCALAFGIGYVPQRWALRQTRNELTLTKDDAALTDLHRRLGVAALAAQRLDSSSATVAASQFFDGLRAYLTTHNLPDEPRTRIALESYLGERDAIVAALAQGNPNAATRLGDLYLTMDQVLRRR